MTIRDHAIDIFAEAGMLAQQVDALPDALAELDVRLQIAGCGPLLEQLMALEFTDRGHDKRDPKPVPTPKPPPPPPRPTPPPPTKGST